MQPFKIFTFNGGTGSEDIRGNPNGASNETIDGGAGADAGGGRARLREESRSLGAPLQHRHPRA